MFIISKQSIHAEVNMNAGYLSLVLLNPDGRFTKAHTAILASMKILAQIHLGKAHTDNSDAVLFAYFTLHGWTVTI